MSKVIWIQRALLLMTDLLILTTHIVGTAAGAFLFLLIGRTNVL